MRHVELARLHITALLRHITQYSVPCCCASPMILKYHSPRFSLGIIYILSIMGSFTSLAKTTIVLSWLSVLLACTSSLAQLVWLRINKRMLSVGDECVCAALVVGILLVAQTTWAIVDEGAGKHQADLSQRNIAAVAKVSNTDPSVSPDANIVVVSHR
jgi:hypothetical protein